MRDRRNENDVTNRVNTTDSQAVNDEIRRIYLDLYQKASAADLDRSFHDLAHLYRGEAPGYLACETDYHDIQHVLDVTLAMARLMDGYERAARVDGPLGERLFRFGIVTALYHDCGYIRHRKDTKHHHGAEYTITHVSRGGRFLEEYLPTIGMADLAQAGARTIHFTGYEIPVHKIKVEPIFRIVGNLLGSADILAQMADRCYLEKCYDRLYPEFVLGGIARRRKQDGSEEIIFESAADLIKKTPRFYQGATKRLTQDLGGSYSYIEQHFGGQNLYFDELERNIEHARTVAVEGDMSLLRRRPPRTTTTTTTTTEKSDADQLQLI